MIGSSSRRLLRPGAIAYSQRHGLGKDVVLYLCRRLIYTKPAPRNPLVRSGIVVPQEGNAVLQ